MIVLAAINAKYIHSNLAVYALKAFAEQEGAEALPELRIAEYTINQPIHEIMGALYETGADVIAFSCYIWNLEYVCRLAKNLKAVMPRVEIWLGGPEVSYHGIEFMEQHPYVDLIILGEGELAFSELVKGKDREAISGIVYRRRNKICLQPAETLVSLDRLPFLYQDMRPFEHRIVYYESSRGCPFRCSYCLSSIDKQVRFRKIELVKKELQFFLEHGVPQVKFIDRTFNCDPERAKTIWEYIAKQDNGITNFHFEIAADLLTAEQLKVLKGMRKGLIQLEIGLQSTNPQTLQAIERHTDLDRLGENIRQIHAYGNIHQHLDLIAGLPYEGFTRFRQSFDTAYAMGVEQLQLGFLKVLKGSPMEERADEYDLRYADTPPYEVLSTRWLSFGELLKLKQVEEMLEVYHNSGQFQFSLAYLMQKWDSPFDFFLALGEFYRENGYWGRSWKRLDRYDILRRFCRDTMQRADFCMEKLECFLLHDLYLRENLKKRPSWAKEWGKEYGKQFAVYFRKAGYSGRNVHLEPWKGQERQGYMLYDYEKISPFDHAARTEFIPEEEFQTLLAKE